ncbi:Cullin-domain-containing protein [Schizopora paradoxa]|uniref:Cullin-domain-containing protein n=1 Tax=Schizopora paradoxa TaxID=27342 RepID=A0A0H2S0Q0_9AGAM|nr:Cullin-domain-containing protein [Schizopora paradoxa]
MPVRNPLHFVYLIHAISFIGSGKWIYDKLKLALNSTTSDISKSLCSNVSHPVEWLSELVSAANWFGDRVKLLQGSLTYLDRAYLLHQTDLRTIKLLSMELFDLQVFKSAAIQERLSAGIEAWISSERKSGKPHQNREIIKKLMIVLHEYSKFNPLFFETFLKETLRFYQAESENLSGPNAYKESPGEFLVHCDKRISEERQRAREVLALFPWCEGDIQKTTEEALLKGRLQWLSGVGLENAIASKNIAGLGRMYSLFSRVDGLKRLCEEFKAKVTASVAKIVNDKEREEEMVDRLLELKGFIDEALPIAFVNVSISDSAAANVDVKPTRTTNIDFVHAASDAFQAGFRGRKLKPAEMIAKYLDRAMRKGQQDATTEDFNKVMQRVLVLYRYTQDKDVFRTFYHKALARRLLTQRSASDQSEKQVLKILKENYDPEFSMGDQMFIDLDLSDDLTREFYKRYPEPEAEALSVKILQRSFWPFVARQKEDIRLPLFMQDVLSNYVNFYKGKHENRKLDFDHSLGTAQMHAQFKAGSKELTLSLYQAVILLMFNDQNVLSYNEIKENTGLNDEELKRTLQSLACGKKKVLKKKPVGKDVNDTDEFIYNADFTDPRQKVHINSIQVKETIEESKKTQSIIEGDRKHYLDAAIVRVMKAKKNMMHQALITATIDAVNKHFTPDVRMIKERIERLIEEEYMRRDDEVDGKYVYVA